MSKTLVICCDGTNNEIAGDATNVLRLFRCAVRNDAQRIYYDAGVGTTADPTAFWPWRRWRHKTIDAAVGMSIRPHVLKAYRFLMQTYDSGDRLFLFGFSRGAYTVRALAGILHRCGLLRPEHDDLTEYAWMIYSDEDRSRDAAKQFGGTARLKKVFAREVAGLDGRPTKGIPVEFIGVWDTVSAFGWTWDPLTLPDTRTNPSVRTIRHALAIDERRRFFLPNDAEAADGQDCRAVWFAGAHADIGGGYPEAEAGLARITLRWMLGEATAAGLMIDAAVRDDLLARMGPGDVDDACAQQHDESRLWRWRFLSLIPRLVYRAVRQGDRIVLSRRLSLWNWSQARTIPPAALVHVSVDRRRKCPRLGYNPKLPPDARFVDEHDRMLSKAEAATTSP